MQFSADVLSPSLAWGCAALAAVLLAYALPGLRAVLRSAGRVHLVAGAMLWLAVLWSMNAPMQPGVVVHVLGTPSVVLLLGWRLGILAAAFAALVLVRLGVTTLLYAPASWLMFAVVPGAVILGIAWTMRFYMPRNPFVFIAGAYFGGGAGIASSLLIVCRPDWVRLYDEAFYVRA